MTGKEMSDQDPAPAAPPQRTWRQEFIRTAWLLTIIGAFFSAGIFAAESLGTLLERRSQQAEQSAESAAPRTADESASQR